MFKKSIFHMYKYGFIYFAHVLLGYVYVTRCYALKCVYEHESYICVRVH